MGRCVGCNQNAVTCGCFGDLSTILGFGTHDAPFHLGRSGFAADWADGLTSDDIDFADDTIVGVDGTGGPRRLILPDPFGPNSIPNSDFTALSRGMSWAAPQTQTADLWATVGSATLHLSSIEAFAPGDIPGHAEAGYFHRSDVSGGSGAGDYAAIQSKMFDVATLAGRDVALSWWAKAAANGMLMGVTLRQFFGAYSGYLDGVPQSLTTDWVRYQVPFTLPDLAGQTITTSDHQLNVYAYFDAGSTFAVRAGSIGHQTGVVDVWGMKLEPGRLATAYARPDPAITRALCMRHVQVWGGAAFSPVGVGTCTSTTVARVVVPYRTPMRKVPTVTPSGTWQIRSATAGALVTPTVTAMAAADATADGLAINCTVASGLTIGAACELRAGNDATARLLFEAD